MAHWLGTVVRRLRVRVATAIALVIAIGLGCLGTSRPPAEALFGAEVADPLTDVGTSLGDMGAGAAGLAVHPITAVTYGATGLITLGHPASSLVTIDTSTAAATLASGFGLLNSFLSSSGGGRTLADLSFDAMGGLYGQGSGSSGDLHHINAGSLHLAGETTGFLPSVTTTAGTTMAAGPMTMAGGPMLSGDPGGSQHINALPLNGSTSSGTTSPSHDLTPGDTATGVIKTLGGPAVSQGNGIDATALTTQAVPEPSALILALTGAAALLLRRRRTRRPGP